MSLENLSSVFNDISKNIKRKPNFEPRSGDVPPENTQLKTQVNDTNFNILNKIDRIDIRGDSPVGNLALDAGNFTNLPFFKGNMEFKLKTDVLQSKISLLGTFDDGYKIDHNFGFTLFDDIVKIPPILKQQKDSPQTQRQIGEFTGYGEKNDEKVDNRKITITTEEGRVTLGTNNKLGFDKLTFGSLYNLNH